ncbi:nucleotidyl transferase AbiEii/AbiGii toxin family protein [Pararhizobium sp. BT-229]|uniref:nucleotidyl transferase AbiEii/AbiGii toxin family protein n=1 Tax=Pararhizobium sp. BT-229 TaxID=2986923 RepID=UPI0021F6CB5F|nr:nucleotidyl transferase AbiEii/AbiGii toxin family protein [Pararhizobium sp. BT-229]MCV9963730.1 nucleotidyl transferase AbiEii/AbiGii toxin family protein [Pararhizobium sp. BT-229]
MKNVGESVLAHLRNLSRETKQDMQSYIRLYAQQRLLYRISVSSIAPSFVLKGGVMLAAYNDGHLFRSSEDIDFNGYLKSTTAEGATAEVVNAIRIAVSTPVPDDGVVFDLSTMTTKKEHVGRIPGSKVMLFARLHTARIPLSVDVGFGNVITPDAVPMEIPTLLPGLVPCPVIAGYPLETIIAEKLHAVRQFGMDNTRHKDLFDLWRIQENYKLNGATVSKAVALTFEHQGSTVETDLPGLSEDYIERNTGAWAAFLRKNALKAESDFRDVGASLRHFADPIMEGAAGRLKLGTWLPGQGWDTYAPSLTF